MFKFKTSVLALMVIPFAVIAQRKSSKPVPVAAVIPAKPTNKADSLPSAPKPYGQIITSKAKTYNGLFKIDLVGLRYFFEIPDSLLGRDILVVNRIAKSAAGIRNQMIGFAGDEIAENVIRFERGPMDRIFLKQVSFFERSADSTKQGMFQAVKNSNLQPIVASFNIKAVATDTITKAKRSVIDVTDYLNTENEIFYFNAYTKKTLGLGALQADRSYIESIRPFSINVEIKTVRTYQRVSATPGAETGIPATYELNSSILLLPKTPMKARYADSRVGYFATGYIDYDANPQGIKSIAMITRWRMEPKDEDIEKYKRGELVEPKKPIVFYIDPATPKKWIPYLIQGVNDWQKAFEQAGFKNAIIAKEAPSDSTWSIDDASHNAIVYKPSYVSNASGPHVHDPRSGEIIETHVNWYHNVMQLIHDWYMIQAGAVDPRARKMQFDDELMGQLIRFVSSHEVGHTLGLMHNFGSSSTVPVEKLRDKAFVEANGHTPSIMDYARFNYVAQPEDHITEKGIFPRIGDYDKWAIEWGYKWMPQYNTADDETPFLNKWIINRLNENKRLWFGIEGDINDPRSQNEDLGDDAMLAGYYGIKNLKRILPNLQTWTREPNEGYESLKAIYAQLVSQFNLYLTHVTKNVGGLCITPKSVEQAGPVYTVTPYQKQKDAMLFLNKNIFTTPTWILNSDINAKTGITATAVIKNSQYYVLTKLIGAGTFTKLLNAENSEKEKTYTITDFLTDLKSGIWGELYSHKNIDVYRRNLQRMYIDNCLKLFISTTYINLTQQGNSVALYIVPDPTSTDVSSVIRAHLVELRASIRKAIPYAKGLSRTHLEDLIVRIDYGLKPKEPAK
jgi:hypothetical protein